MQIYVRYWKGDNSPDDTGMRAPIESYYGLTATSRLDFNIIISDSVYVNLHGSRSNELSLHDDFSASN